MGDLTFTNQTVIVTGAGRGIGRAHALEFARRGASVVVNDIAAEAATDVVAEIARNGGSAVSSSASVATQQGGAELIDTALQTFGSVEVLLNNAGSVAAGYFEDLTMEQHEAMLDVHLRALFFTIAPAWAVMKKQQYGRLIMTSSSSGMLGHQGLAGYAAAKAGVYGLAKALAYEGEEHGITCNTVLPSAETPLTQSNVIPDMAKARARFGADTSRFPADMRRPELISSLVVYLASRACTVSGEAFSVVAGRYARVFVGITDGWLARSVDEATPEAIQNHFDQIRDIDRITIPMWSFEEQASVLDLHDRLAAARTVGE